jgi:hypothetical protein
MDSGQAALLAEQPLPSGAAGRGGTPPLGTNSTGAMSPFADVSGSVASLGVASSNDDGADHGAERAQPFQLPRVAIAWASHASAQVYLTIATWSPRGPSGGWRLTLGAAAPTPVAVGVAPHVSFAALGSEPNASGTSDGVLMLVHGEGFCQNNDEHNKDARVSVCEVRAASTAGVLVASYGMVADVEDKLKTGGLFSACDERVMHGAYSRGSHPPAALYAAQGDARLGTSGTARLLYV